MKRFEELYNENEYNVFKVDAFLNRYRDKKELSKLLETIGYSNEDILKYEREKGLPEGILELSVLMHDEQFQKVVSFISECKEKNVDLYDGYLQDKSISAFRQLGLKYPDAFRFLRRHGKFVLDQDHSGAYLDFETKKDIIPVWLFPVAVLAAGWLAALYQYVVLVEVKFWTKNGGDTGGNE